jgi:hypothetical protein
MNTLIALAVALLSATHVTAQVAPRSADGLLRAVLKAVQDQSLDAQSPSRSRQPMFRPGIALVVDRDDFDRHVVKQGFVSDHRDATTALDGLVFRNRSWSKVRSCTPAAASTPPRCTLPPGTVVVRVGTVVWSADRSDVTVQVGAYRRSEVSGGQPGIGGTVSTYTFRLRKGAWVLIRTGRTFTS